jgi:hypothetical protein
MKRIYSSLLLIIPIGIALLYVQSCKRDISKDDYVQDDKFVSINEAKTIAENINYSGVFSDSTQKSSLKSSNNLDKKFINDSVTISDKNDKKSHYFYVFNYKSGGFCIISADSRIYPIMAFSDNGKFNTKLDSLPLGLVKWMEASATIIKEVRKQKIKSSAILDQHWASLINPSTIIATSRNSTLKNAPITPPKKTTVYTVGPLLKTNWDQGCGYNSHCPVASDGPCGYALTGCVATAMAQVMAYWKSPSKYSWSTMPNNSGNDAVAILMRDIGNSVGMGYGGSSSGAQSTNIAGALKNTFKYSSATYSDSYNYDIVRSNLDNYNPEPVLLGGCSNQSTFLGIPYSWSNCHEWVCDGYKDYNLSSGQGYLYFDMNWGWGSTYNGWYSFSNDWPLPNGWDFKYADDMVYNIHP